MALKAPIAPNQPMRRVAGGPRPSFRWSPHFTCSHVRSCQRLLILFSLDRERDSQPWLVPADVTVGRLQSSSGRYSHEPLGCRAHQRGDYWVWLFRAHRRIPRGSGAFFFAHCSWRDRYPSDFWRRGTALWFRRARIFRGRRWISCLCGYRCADEGHGRKYLWLKLHRDP